MYKIRRQLGLHKSINLRNLSIRTSGQWLTTKAPWTRWLVLRVYLSTLVCFNCCNTMDSSAQSVSCFHEFDKAQITYPWRWYADVAWKLNANIGDTKHDDASSNIKSYKSWLNGTLHDSSKNVIFKQVCSTCSHFRHRSCNFAAIRGYAEHMCWTIALTVSHKYRHRIFAEAFSQSKVLQN